MTVAPVTLADELPLAEVAAEPEAINLVFERALSDAEHAHFDDLSVLVANYRAERAKWEAREEKKQK